MAPSRAKFENPSIENISFELLTDSFKIFANLDEDPDFSENVMQGKPLPADPFQAYVRQTIATGSSMYLLAIDLKLDTYMLKNIDPTVRCCTSYQRPEKTEELVIQKITSKRSTLIINRLNRA